MNTIPVYSGEVVDATGYDRLGIFVKYTWRADKADERKAAKEAASDTITFVGKPRAARPGEVPAATAKTIQQERAEKAAAKIASKNQQRGTKREATKAKRTETAKPVVQAKPTPPPAEPKKKRGYQPRIGIVPANATAVVCVKTGRFWRSIFAAEKENGYGKTVLRYIMRSRALPAHYKGGIYDFATAAEMRAGKCLRTPADFERIGDEPYRGGEHRARPIMLLGQERVFQSVTAMARWAHMKRDRLSNLLPGEVRHTPAGDVRLASEQEIQQWKLAHGGQMPIAFNQNR